MKIIISYKNITADKPLEVFVNEKIGSLERFIKDDNVMVRVEIGRPSQHHRSGKVYYAEANLKIGNKLLRAQATHLDLRAAITEIKNELQVQIKKIKEKFRIK